ncbi:MAG: type IV secretion system DNA-binding domain-containing protein [Candidatus Pelagibacter ubique]
MVSNSYKEPKLFKGFEVYWHAMQMSAKMHTYVILLLLLCQILIPMLYIWIFKFELVKLFFQCLFSTRFEFLSVVAKKIFQTTWVVFVLATPIWLLYPTLLRLFKKKAEAIVKDEHLRGSKIVSEDEFLKIIKPTDSNCIHFGKIPVPREVENRHFMIVGRPGVGKTTLLNSVIEALRNRGEKAIVYDFKGDYLSTFYDPNTDVIFNPIDARCVNWCLFSEIEIMPDIDSIATSLIPPSYYQDKFWVDAARDVFSAILYYLKITGEHTNEAIWSMVSKTEPEMLELMSQAVAQGIEPGKRALGYLAGYERGSKVGADVLSTMRQYTNCFLYMRHLEGGFSLKRWLDTDGSSFMFVVNYANLRDTLAPILSLIVDLAMKHILSMPENISRRRYIIIDEFASLQRLPTIVQALEQGRSKGISTWIAMQDIAQIQKKYGLETTNTIANTCGTCVCFAVADPQSQEFISRIFGEQEILETDESLSMGPQDMRDGLSLSRRRKIEKVILPSQLGNLPDFHFFLKMLSYPIVMGKTQWKSYSKRADALQMNPIFLLKKEEV